VPRALPLVSTKLHVPRVADYVERPRLLRRLDETLDEATRLTLLSAPPGYGKSVAIAGWLAACGVDAAWLSLDPGDNDPVRFLRYVAAALSPLRPDADAIDPSLIGGGGSEAGALLVDAIGSRDEPFVLVLDDYHVIDSAPVHALVRFLVDHGPPFSHLVIGTREDPPLPLARLRAHRRLVELRADDLRCSMDEAAAYLAVTGDGGLDEGHVARLAERTEGWMAGLQLAAISLRGRSDAPELIEAFAGSQRYVLDYLASEVLDGLDPGLREFIVRVSVAERFTATMCRALTDRADSADLLDRAERLNLFLIPLDQERRWYRFHHLFAGYLRTLLDPAAEAALRERAATFLEDAGLPEEAIEQAVAAGAVDRAIRLLERHARPTYEAGELTTLLRWLDALPSETVAASAELISLRAVSDFFVGRVGDARTAWEQGEAASGASGAHGALLAVQAMMAAYADRIEAIPIAEAACAALTDDPLFGPIALQALGTGHLVAGDLEASIAASRPALAAVADSGRSMLVVPAMTALVSALDLAGGRAEAEALCRRTLADHAEEARRYAGGTPYAMYWLGWMLYEAGDVEGALYELERSWTAMGTFGFGRAILTRSVAYLAMARRAAGRYPDALEAVRTVRRDARAAGLDGLEETFDEIDARLRLWQGDLPAAGRWADRLERSTAVVVARAPTRTVARTAAAGPALHADDTCRRTPWQRLWLTLGLARVRVAQGRPWVAGPLLAEARAAATAAGAAAELITIDVIEATRLHAAGDRGGAAHALERAVRNAAVDGYVRRIADDAGPVATLLPAVRAAAPELVDRIAAALGRPVEATAGPLQRPVPPETLVEPLTERELEVLGLMAQGRSDAAIARELFVSLATAKWHAAHIRAKLGVASRTQAVLRAQELGLA
jgi:ATP/maltotriose-dependent transcriptional regulator MalT